MFCRLISLLTVSLLLTGCDRHLTKEDLEFKKIRLETYKEMYLACISKSTTVIEKSDCAYDVRLTVY